MTGNQAVNDRNAKLANPFLFPKGVPQETGTGNNGRIFEIT